MKKRSFRFFASFISIPFLVCGLSLQFTVSSVQARPLLRVGIHHVGTDITQDAAGNFYGMETDFMQALGSYAGREVVFVPGTWEECRFRLERGEIDVISGIVKTPQREQTMRFSRLMMGRANDSRDVHGTLLPHRVNQLYFAVRRDDEALMQELDLAADQLIGNRPYFVSHLYQLYYGQRGSAELRLTEREQRFLKSHPVISAVVVAREAPFAYVDKEGNLQGTMKKLADRLERDLGIKLALVIEQDYAAAQEDLDKGRAQILLNAEWDASWAAAHNTDLSAAYLTSYYTTVTRRNGAPRAPRIACLQKRLTDRVLLERYEANQIHYYATAEECLRAVSNGQADIAFLRQESAQYNIWQGDFPDLVTDGIVTSSQDIAIGISDQMEPELLSILDKEIRFIGPNGIFDYASFYDQGLDKRRSIRSLFYAYPQYFITGLLLLFFILLLLTWRQSQMRRSHLKQMQHIIDTDRYTGLYNRSWFKYEASKYLKGHEAQGHFAIVEIGISRRDILVETYGQDVIVELLRRMEATLQKTEWAKLPAVHTSTGRVFFLLHMDAFDDRTQLTTALTHLMHLNEYISIGHLVVHIAFHIGICPLKPGLSVADAMNHANLALHEANPICFYNAEMQQKAEFQSRIESLQQGALSRKEFEVWYQPKYDLATRKCIGAEALVRWRSRELGFMMPGQFIPRFESNGFITQLDFYMLTHVMETVKERRTTGLPIVPVSVNQSRLHMQEKNYLAYMQRLKTYYGAEDIELELTETAFDFDTPEMRQHALHVMHELHEMGFRLSIDDFGSGYSDLTILNAIPLDVMKIDRSLLLAANGAKRMQAVLARMIDLGHALGMTVICEGIEEHEQEEMLRSYGCDHGQGYLYGKPMPEAEFSSFLEHHI